MANIIYESERELEDHICKHLDEGINLITDEAVSFYKRQFKIGLYGIADIVISSVQGDDYPNFLIIELKKDIVNANAVSQISRYIVGLKHYLCDLNIPYNSVTGAVVAPRIDDDTILVLDEIECISAYEVKFDFKLGLIFEELNGWTIVNANFSEDNNILIKTNELSKHQIKSFDEFLNQIANEVK